MLVRNNARGLGIVRKLVEFSEEQARADGKQFLRLYTSTSKGEAAAQVLYEKPGYKIVERTPHSLPRVFVVRFSRQRVPGGGSKLHARRQFQLAIAVYGILPYVRSGLERKYYVGRTKKRAP